MSIEEDFRLVEVWVKQQIPWETFIRQLVAWGEIAPLLESAFSRLGEAIDTVAIYLEHGLAFEPYPLQWVSYQHGNCDENPHVWYRLGTYGQEPSAADWCASESSGFVLRSNDRCTCGMTYGEWKAEQDIARRIQREMNKALEISLVLGLISRNVQ